MAKDRRTCIPLALPGTTARHWQRTTGYDARMATPFEVEARNGLLSVKLVVETAERGRVVEVVLPMADLLGALPALQETQQNTAAEHLEASRDNARFWRKALRRARAKA